MENSIERQEPTKIESLDAERSSRLKEKYSQLMNSEAGMEFYSQASRFINNLIKKCGNGEVYKYELYHLLGGSSMGEQPAFFDFPGEDSIATFIEKEWQKEFKLKDNSQI